MEEKRGWFSTSEGFGFVPRYIFDAGLSVEAVALYAAMAVFADQDGKCYPSQRVLCDMLGRTRGSIWKAMKELEGKGLIRVIRRKATVNRYQFINPNRNEDE